MSYLIKIIFSDEDGEFKGKIIDILPEMLNTSNDVNGTKRIGRVCGITGGPVFEVEATAPANFK